MDSRVGLEVSIVDSFDELLRDLYDLLFTSCRGETNVRTVWLNKPRHKATKLSKLQSHTHTHTHTWSGFRLTWELVTHCKSHQWSRGKSPPCYLLHTLKPLPLRQSCGFPSDESSLTHPPFLKTKTSRPACVSLSAHPSSIISRLHVRQLRLITLFLSQPFRWDLLCPSTLTSSRHWEEGLARSDSLSLSLSLCYNTVVEEVLRSFIQVKVLR